MANPQPTHFTRISNEIMEHLALSRISGREWQILLVIFRKTYGFQKKSDFISMSQFAKLTGMKRPDVAEQIKNLLGKSLIGVTQNPNSNGINSYIFQKDWEQWKVLPKKQGVRENPNRVLGKTLTEGVRENPTYKRNNTKETNTKEKDYRSFDTFWKEYPRKVGKVTALKSWTKLSPSDELVTEIMAGLQRHKATKQWSEAKEHGRYILHPTTWLNGRRWEDEVIIGEKPFKGLISAETFAKEEQDAKPGNI